MLLFSTCLLVAVLRIISLAPSLTEDLFAIGVGPNIVGVDTYSDRPAQVRRLPRVGALVGVSAEQVVALHPTLVLGISYQAPVLRQLRRYGVATYAIDDTTMADVYHTFRQLGALTAHQSQAASVIGAMQHEIAQLTRRAALLPARSTFVVIGSLPIFTAGRTTYLTTLVRAAHLDPIIPAQTIPWPTFSAEMLALAAPQTLVLPDGDKLPSGAPWSELPAVRHQCILRLDSDALLRPGPRVVEVLRELIEEREHSRGRC